MNFMIALLARMQAAGVGTQAVNMFINHIPPNLNAGLALLNSLHGNAIDYELPGFRRVTFQLVVRARDIATAQTMVDNAVQALTITKETTFSGFNVKYVRPKHDPVTYPLTGGNNIEFSVNFDATYVIV